MRNRPKPGTRSYAANGGEVVKSDSPKDGHRDEKPVTPEKVELEASEEEKARIQADLEMAKAELDAAVKANTKLETQVNVLKKDANKAEIILEATESDEESDD